MINATMCLLREWRPADVERLARIASHADVSQYLTDRFPYPYTVEDAQWWVGLQRGFTAVNNFAIEVNGELAGGIGMDPLEGERRIGAAIGYWLGREYWGHGIATAACRAFSTYALNERGFVRLEAATYAPNVASMRVLEKCGYTHEGTMRKAVIKRGVVLDAYLYAKIKDGP